MRSSNPVMRSLTDGEQRGQQSGYGAPGVQDSPYGQQSTYQSGYDAASGQQARPMTVDDVVTKTGITLAVIVVMAIVNFGLALMGHEGVTMALTAVGAIGGFIMTLISTFGRKFGSAWVTLIYAVFEGLFVGGISIVFAGYSVGGSNMMTMIGQAIIGTVGVFVGMLFVYKTGAVKVTPRFNKIMMGAIIGVVVLALGNLLLFMFTGMNPLRGGGTLAIIFSLVCIGLAAMSFLTDFDQADRLVRAGAPANYAWGVALGLAVTLVWLYTEILRLLSYFNHR